MKNVIDALVARGFVDQMTSSDLREAVKKSIGVYHGIDPTADSLHLGNLVGIMALAWFQKFGHQVYALIGGATGRIGDPSGKSTERPLLTEQALEYNVEALTSFCRKILAFPNGPRPIVLNNFSWLGSFSLIDFLRDVGKHFRMGPMLAKESVRTRIQSDDGMSFTEFSYQLLQGYDFHYLAEKHGICLQLGGSDQWGNITAGIEFHRKLKGEPIYGLTYPLLTRSDGKKFGKSEEGAIWLSSEKLSAYQFYQHLVRMPDADIIRLLKMLTFLELEEIEHIELSMKSPAYEPNTAQKVFAEAVTLFVHGEEGLQAALRVTKGMAPGALSADLSAEGLREIASDMPKVRFHRKDVIGQKWIDLAVQATLVPSKAEGRRLVENGGAYLNNQRIEDAAQIVHAKDLIGDQYLLLSAGKKKRILIELEI